MNYPKVMKTKAAAPRRSKMDLSSTTVSTLDFGVLRPIFSKRMYRGDTFNVDMSSFVRLLPVGLPTLGECYLETHTVFVPYRILSPYWMPFIEGRKNYSYNNQILSTPSKVPIIKNTTIVQAFLESESGSRVALVEYKGQWIPDDSQSVDTCDFSVVDSRGGEGNISAYNFTPRGKAFYALLRGLGYSINWTLDVSGSSADRTEFSALPLLAFLRYYFDYVLNPARDDISILENFFTANKTELTYSDLIDIAAYYIHTNYDTDYFNASWLYPNGNDVNQGSSVSINAFSPVVAGAGMNNHVVSNVAGSNQGVSIETQRASETANRAFTYEQHQIMMSLYNYMRRNQLVGTRYGQQLLARFGFQPSDIKSVISEAIAQSRTPIQISDVTSTAAGSFTDDGTDFQSAVGTYAGKGIGYSQDGNFSFTADDYGQLIIIATIKPVVRYWQGRDRETLDSSRLDFFTPEFEKVGTQALRFDELFSNFYDNYYYSNAENNHSIAADSVFGFVPRYAHQKIGHDLLIGDFNVRTLQSTLDAFHLFRNLKTPYMPDSIGGAGEDVGIANNSRFVSFDEGERFQYDRMFTFQGSEVDHFICRFDFRIIAIRPMNTIVDTMLTDEDLTGEYVKVAVNGVKN